MSHKILSIAVPAYNMEKFISRCLDSVTSEDVPDTLEVIVINDGSTDSTLSIAKEYECRRPDIIKIIDKENGHYGSCVNAAMRIATGKYFRMVDADDWVDTGVLVELLHKLSNSDADLVVTVRTECIEKENAIEYHSHELTNVTFDKTLPASEIDFKELFGSDLNKLGMHNMTYKLEVLRKSETHLDEKIPYTDVQYCSQPIAYTKTIVFLDLKLYLYYIGRTGQSVSPDN